MKLEKSSCVSRTLHEIPQALRCSVATALVKLRALRRGSLAVPAEDGRPALPLRTNRPSFDTKPPRFAPSGLGEFHRICSRAESPSLRRRWAVAKPIGKIGEQARRVRPTQTVFYLQSTSVKQPPCFLHPREYLKYVPSVFSSPRMSVGRTSDEGGDSAGRSWEGSRFYDRDKHD